MPLEPGSYRAGKYASGAANADAVGHQSPAHHHEARCAAAAHAAVPKPLTAALSIALLSRFSITYTGRRDNRKNAESALQWISVHFATQRNGWAPVQRKRRAASNTRALDCRHGLHKKQAGRRMIR